MNSILTVSAVNTYLSFKLKNDPKLKGIALEGEISDLSVNSSSGHMYFSLTDGKSSIRAVMFSSNASKLKFYPQIGMSVIAFGGIDVYERGGIYQLNCTQLVPKGVGEGALQLAQLKDELSKLGVFSKPKRAVVKYPKKIAVVTSPTGAAIADIMSVVNRRYPIVKIELFPAVVQGLTAPKSIALALAKADECGADTIILARGGGSNEDLSCFNTKEAVMAVYNCKTPVVSAVGHEIDVSLCDLAADLRAPTPTGAAELCTPNIDEIDLQISYLRENIKKNTIKKLEREEASILSIKQLISAYSPASKLMRFEKEVISYKQLIKKLTGNKISVLESRVRGYQAVLSGYDPKNKLSKGYALVYRNGELITDAKMLLKGDKIEIVMRDGKVDADIN